jgi:ketosteroid isomerase-like protein
MTFPGEHSWGATYRGKAEVEAFLRRFLDAGLRGSLGTIWVSGPPWATRIALEFTDHAHDPATGERIYANDAVLVLRTRFGRVVREEVYEDTQKVAAFDAALAARDEATAAVTPTVTA